MLFALVTFKPFQMWTDRVKNGEVLHGVKEDRNILYTVKQRKANLIGHRLRWNCFIRQVIEGKMEEKKRRGRRHKRILDAQ